MNKFKYTLDNKRYHTLNYFFKTYFNEKVFKVSLNQNFTCPNIDGTKGYGGCTYCLNGSNDNDLSMNLKEQFESVKNTLLKKWPNSKYIAYFQANTNTYGPLNILKSNCEEVLGYDNVIGLFISTRCDAINEEVLDYLSELNKKTFLVVEVGLQTIHESTSKLINRCHTLNEFDNMVYKLKERNIKVLVHIINGLPYETKDMMIETVKHINKLNIWGIKIHMLHILKGTGLNNMYQKNKFDILSKEDYIDVVIKQLEVLDEKVVINRITGDPIKELLVEPTWLIKKFCLLNDIDIEMKKRDTYQGKFKEF